MIGPTLTDFPCFVRVARTDPDGVTTGETWVAASLGDARAVVHDQVHGGLYACASTVRVGFDNDPITLDSAREGAARDFLGGTPSRLVGRWVGRA